MKRSITTAAILACAALFLTSNESFAQISTPVGGHHRHRRISPEQKQASDQAMQAGLSQLQAAAGALQSNPGQSVGDLQSAVTSMNNALSIYHGQREHAIHAADHAVKELQRNGRRSQIRASTTIAKAISEAQAALQTN